MKFESFKFAKDLKWIHLLPDIELIFDQPIYYYDNFAISVHFLIWHFRWLWMKREESDER